jgi:hypothetical protein
MATEFDLDQTIEVDQRALAIEALRQVTNAGALTVGGGTPGWQGK